jgi:hypothetical protein
MESHLIVQGFKHVNSLIDQNNLNAQLKFLVGDGDTSVIRELRKHWGHVEKIQCANHAVKSLRSALESLLASKPEWKNILTKGFFENVVRGARSAVNNRSRQLKRGEMSRQDAERALVKDISNGFKHYLGIHLDCSSEYCSHKGDAAIDCSMLNSQPDPPLSTAPLTDTNDTSNLDTQGSEVANFEENNEPEFTLDKANKWILHGVDIDAMLWFDRVEQGMQAKHAEHAEVLACNPIDVVAECTVGNNFSILLDKDKTSALALVSRLKELASRLADKERLIDNCTMNAAEGWFSVKQVFEGGKKRNLIQRGRFQQRMTMLGLRITQGTYWISNTYSVCFDTRAPPHLVTMATSKEQRLQADRKRQSSLSYKRQRSFKRRKHATTVDAEEGVYKPNADVSNLGIEDKLTEDALNEKMDLALCGLYQLDPREIAIIGVLKQGTDGWKRERRIRITASLAGKICKTKKSTHRGKLALSITNPSLADSTAMLAGREAESNILQLYTLFKNQIHDEKVSVRVTGHMTGLVVDAQHQWLAASPDGIVEVQTADAQVIDRGLVEVKYLYSMAKLKLTIEQAVALAEKAEDKHREFCLEAIEMDGVRKIQLKRSRNYHHYFYQVQMLLHCTGLEWCDFVCATISGPTIAISFDHLHVERIHRDDDFWNTNMFPHIKSFFFDALLPEVAAPHMQCNLDLKGPRDLTRNLGGERKAANLSNLPKRRLDSDMPRQNEKNAQIAKTRMMGIDSEVSATDQSSKSDQNASQRRSKRRKLLYFARSRISNCSDYADEAECDEERESVNDDLILEPICQSQFSHTNDAFMDEAVVCNDGVPDLTEMSTKQLREYCDHSGYLEDQPTCDDQTIWRSYTQECLALPLAQRFPLLIRASIGRMGPSFPITSTDVHWKSFARARHARIWDFLGGGSLSADLKQYLEVLGFNVACGKSRAQQQPNACGYVAARVLATAPRASWLSFDGIRATGKEWIRKGNELLELDQTTDAIWLDGVQVLKLTTVWSGSIIQPMPMASDVFVRSLLEDLSSTNPGDEPRYCIVNTHKSDQHGMHWIAVIYDMND